jgi:hypothetical protein
MVNKKALDLLQDIIEKRKLIGDFPKIPQMVSPETLKLLNELKSVKEQFSTVELDNVSEAFNLLGVKTEEINKVASEQKTETKITGNELVAELSNELSSKTLELTILQIKDLQDKKKDNRYWFWSGVISSFIVSVLGGYILNMSAKQPQPTKIEFPKIVVLHDTIYVKAK